MSADIDIDFADRQQIMKLIRCVPARQETNSVSKQHNSGVYVTDIPVDPLHGCASIEYKEADKLGYFKLDFLNMSVYEQVKDNAHYETLLEMEPPWHRLTEKDFVKRLVHLGNHHELVAKMKPDSIPRMAVFLALIRPSKTHLIGKTWAEIAKTIWDKPSEGYYFKKSHSIGYAKLVALHMNILNQLDERE